MRRAEITAWRTRSNCMLLREKAWTIAVDCWVNELGGRLRWFLSVFGNSFTKSVQLLVDLCISPEIEYIWRSRMQVELQNAFGFKNCAKRMLSS